MPTALTDMVTVAQAAEALGVNRRTIIRRIQSGDLPAQKLGPGTSAWVITRADLERLTRPADAA